MAPERLPGLPETKLPEWQNFALPAIALEDLLLRGFHRNKKKLPSPMTTVRPRKSRPLAKVGHPLNEQKDLRPGVVVEAVFDSIPFANL